MKSLPLAVLLFLSATAFAQPATPPCTPGKVCRPAAVETPGNVYAAGEMRFNAANTRPIVFSCSSATTTCSSPTAALRYGAYGAGDVSFEGTGGAREVSVSGGVTTYTGPVVAATYMQAAQYLRSVGIAFGSFPTCNGGIAGAIYYDTTSSCNRQCNGSAWGNCLASAAQSINNYWSSICFGTCATENANFTGAIYGLGGTTARTTCSWATAGVGGSTGVVVKIRNVTDATDSCTCTLGACTTAANTPINCTCAATITSAKVHTIQLDSTTDCGTNPANIVCTTSVTP